MLFKDLQIGDKFTVKPLPKEKGTTVLVAFIKTGSNKAVSLVNGVTTVFSLIDVIKISEDIMLFKDLKIGNEFIFNPIYDTEQEVRVYAKFIKSKTFMAVNLFTDEDVMVLPKMEVLRMRGGV